MTDETNQRNERTKPLLERRTVSRVIGDTLVGAALGAGAGIMGGALVLGLGGAVSGSQSCYLEDAIFFGGTPVVLGTVTGAIAGARGALGRYLNSDENKYAGAAQEADKRYAGAD